MLATIHPSKNVVRNCVTLIPVLRVELIWSPPVGAIDALGTPNFLSTRRNHVFQAEATSWTNKQFIEA
jgi:hypothetical protein